ncbi:acyltransferase family protein [Latilactobacillus sakei]|uniref:Acyltransferase 3 domain-containing protein n=1 Tax=Latilactobacillus sakei TaxID=1599 RepID=A0AAX0VBW1_LATSK|nr:acyltransferase family protein [Latilactobacillus sakei]PKX71995.1 hypothetical protein CUR35_04320 [Latilactobacillus sakei]PKX79106.1 hypothetical protein CUR37_03435 [Latilactobacillus sakei]WEY50016.1 acyltransferase family protein [Latilactobacillus sakei]
MKKERNTNIEILRLICMLLIVASHFGSHTSWNFHPGFGWNKFYVQLLVIGGHLGVDIFVIITGYFTIMSKYTGFKKVISLWKQVLYSSWVLFMIAIVIK